MTRIMLVDDEVNVTQALQRVLRRGLPSGVKVECFQDPSKALSRCREATFDVIISDFRMPLMDGIGMLRQVREIQPDAIRLILSASSEVETITQAINDVEVFRYLIKPWNDDELVAHLLAAVHLNHTRTQERQLADETRLMRGELTPQEIERKRLESQEPGITHVEWGPHGEVLMPGLEVVYPDDLPPPRKTRP